MTDGDHYRTYAQTRLAIGSPTTSIVSDTELEEALDDADAEIHFYIGVSSKVTANTNILAKIESDLVFMNCLRNRQMKTSNLPDFNTEFYTISPGLTKLHEKKLDRWLDLNSSAISNDERDDSLL